LQYFTCYGKKSVKSFILKRRTLMKRIVNSSGIKPRCEVQGFFFAF
jgi:hypothetical protein